MGGYPGAGKEKTITRSSPPGFTTVCQIRAGTYSACPAATGTSPVSSRITPLPLTM